MDEEDERLMHLHRHQNGGGGGGGDGAGGGGGGNENGGGDVSNGSNGGVTTSSWMGYTKRNRSLCDFYEGRPIFQFMLPIMTIASLIVRIWSIIVIITRMRVTIDLKPNKSNEEEVYQLFEIYLTDFSFPQMIRDFYKANAFFVAFIIVLGSAVLPILKHVALLGCWLIPVSMNGERVRRNLVLFLDQTGKASFVDLFFLFFVIRIFSTKIRVDVLGAEIILALTPEPVKGIFSGLASTITLTLLSHYVLIVHERQRFEFDTEQLTIATGPPKASLLHRIQCSASMSRLRKWIIITATSLLFIGITISTVGVLSQDFVEFQLGGILGEISSLENPPLKVSVIEFAFNVPKYTDEKTGARFLVMLYFIISIIIPGLIFLISISLWIIPMTVVSQRRLLSLHPFLQSWNSLSVLLITAFACYFEMHLIGNFILESQFKSECDLARTLGFECIDLNHELRSGIYWLLATVIMNEVLFLTILYLGSNLLETVESLHPMGGSPNPYGRNIGGFVVSTRFDSDLLMQSPYNGAGRSWIRAGESEESSPEQTEYRRTLL